jgi:hypothetical protein
MAQPPAHPRYHPRPHWLGCAAAIALLAANLACAVLTPAKTATQERVPNPEGMATDDTSTIAPEEQVPTAPADDTTAASEVVWADTLFLGEADPATSPQPLEIVSQWAGPNRDWDDRAGFAMLVKNPNASLGYQFASFTLTVHDKAGNPLGDPIEADLDMVMPGQTVAFFQQFDNPDKSEIGGVDVQFEPVTPRKAGAQAFPLSVDQVRLVEKGDSLAVTGFVKNASDKDIDYVTLNAVGYDASGKLVNAGGGSAIDFVPGNGQVAVDIRLSGKEKPARVDLFPSLISTSPIEPPSDELENIHIAGVGVRLGSNNSAEYTAIFENTSPEKLYLLVQYNFAIYAEDGSVLAAWSGSTQYLFPNDKVAIMGTMTVPADAKVARADVQFNYPESVERDSPNDRALQLKANPLTASPEVTTNEDEYYYHFTGTISNALDEAVENADVVAVAYDDQNKIIGSARNIVDLPARGQADVKIDLQKTPVKPARVVLFPMLPGNWGIS